MSQRELLNPRDIVSIIVDKKKGNDEQWFVIVISKNLFHASGNYFVGVTIVEETQSLPYLIQIKPRDLESCQLSNTSQVKCDRITTINQRLINEKIGKISTELYSKIMEKIKDVLEL